MQRLPRAWCQPFWQPGLTTVTQSSQAFHNLRLIHFNVFRMRRPDLLQEQERGITSLQSSRAIHWLPIKFRIIYKLWVLMHLVRVGRSPAYLSDTMTSVADLPGRERLRSSSSFRNELPRFKIKFGERSFLFSGPKAWNSLPSNLQELTNTDTFKKLLKTHLFKHAFGELEWLCWCTIGHCKCNWRMKWRNVM